MLLLAKKRSALTALQDQFRARDTGKIYAALVIGDWPKNLKVIDQALHKTLDAAGERHVRVVSPTTTTTAGARSRWCARWRADLPALGVHAAGRHAEDRPHAPDPRAPGARNGHPIVGDPKYGDFALNKASRAAKAWALALRAHVPARGASAFDHPASFRTPHAGGAAAARVRDTAGMICRPQAHCVRGSPRCATVPDRPLPNDLRPAASTSSPSTGTAPCSTRPRSSCAASRPPAATSARPCPATRPTRPTSSAWACTTRCSTPRPACRPTATPNWAQRYRHHYFARQHELVLFPGTLEMLQALKAATTGWRWPPARPARTGRGARAGRSCRASSTAPAPPTRPPASRTR